MLIYVLMGVVWATVVGVTNAIAGGKNSEHPVGVFVVSVPLWPLHMLLSLIPKDTRFKEIWKALLKIS
jgi:hypothetical protein